MIPNQECFASRECCLDYTWGIHSQEVYGVSKRCDDLSYEYTPGNCFVAFSAESYHITHSALNKGLGIAMDTLGNSSWEVPLSCRFQVLQN